MTGDEEVDDESWRDRALCSQTDPSLFFPHEEKYTAIPTKALIICGDCEVRLECLQYAIDCGPELVGVWGGTTENQRILMKRGRPLPKSVYKAPELTKISPEEKKHTEELFISGAMICGSCEKYLAEDVHHSTYLCRECLDSMNKAGLIKRGGEHDLMWRMLRKKKKGKKKK